MSVPITTFPADQRPRERLTALGPHALSDGELLALLLRHGRVGQNALELAYDLLAAYGGPKGLAAARPEELAARAGVGAAKAASIVAAFHLGARVDRDPDLAPRIEGPAVAVALARPKFAGSRTERLLVEGCDAQDRLRHSLFVAEGAIDGVAVPVREILNAVLRHDGCSFVVVHNHPSGNPDPSPEDRHATARLADSARTVGLRFLGSVIIAGERWAATGRPNRPPAAGLLAVE
ncbi:MAG: DNA repair protein [Mycobacteriaceae bacterium]|nr:DNA repair protein [Mycobacteriaceae bacterium]